jgi:hypothetical protein
VPWRNILNTILWVLITWARWYDIPRREDFVLKSSSHRWLGKWQENGTVDKALEIILENAEMAQILCLERLAVAGFLAGKGGGEFIDYGYKGKGMTTHLLGRVIN